MNNPLFTGTCTALVTPFWNGKINYPMLERLIHRQIDAGIQAIVVSGTTGESATLSDQEKTELTAKAKEYAGGQCIVIAGTGSNHTTHSIALSRAAEQAGADAVLVVSPYYNKTTEDGLIAHYCAVADAVRIPVIMYNIPSRTGQDIPVSVCKVLSAVPNIVGIKEASGNISKILKLRAECKDDFCIWSGNDDMIVPIAALGGKGVISVLSNLYPELTQAMTLAALDGDFDTASALQIEMQPIIDALFSQVNPIPIKAAMKIIGYDCGPCRLPLTDAGRDTVLRLKALIQKK